MKILLIEDERDLAAIIKMGLDEAGFDVALAHDSAHSRSLLRHSEERFCDEESRQQLFCQEARFFAEPVLSGVQDSSLRSE